MKFANRVFPLAVLTLLAGTLLLHSGCAGTTGYGGGGGGGTTVPATPTGVAAVAGNAQVALNWTGSSGATGYYVKRSTTTGGPYTQVATQAGTNDTDTGLTNGTKYFYVVSAYNSAGQSANSAEVNATPVLPPPAAPTGLAAAAGNAQVSLSWTASATATSYHVKRSTSSGAETQIAAPTSTSYTDTGLSNGTKYFYEVSAVNSGGESANSPEVSATPVAPVSPPATPTGLQATGGNAQVSLSWNASTGAASYNLKRATTNGGPYNTAVASPTASNYSDTTVTNGTTYYYVVSAVNTVGQSANSAQASATPAAPTANVTISINSAQTKPISPWIYGINAYSELTGTPPGFTFDRAGASRWTAYNWETNASNGGSDYFYDNDDNLSSSTVPDEAVRSFIARDQSNGMATLMTVPLQGLVAADENGPVSLVNPPDMSRFKVLVDQKSTVSSAPFTINPPTSGANVFADES